MTLIQKLKFIAERNQHGPGEPRYDPADLPPDLLTVAEAAAFAKGCGHTIRRWIRMGKLDAYNSGKRIRIDRAELIKFLCNNGQY